MILFQDDIDHGKQLQLVKEQLKGDLFQLRMELQLRNELKGGGLVPWYQPGKVPVAPP